MSGNLFGLVSGCRTVATVGICKNAGKTTVLTRLIRELSEKGLTVGATSIGRDGETVDRVTSTPKPRIGLPSGSLFATADGLLAVCDATKEIVASTCVYTPLGEVVVVRTRSDGFAELAGPSMTVELPPLVDILCSFGADMVLIDGAVSRRSLGAPDICDGLILCAGASFSPDINATVEETAYIASLLSLPEYDGNENNIVIDGAFTDTATRELFFSDRELKGLTLTARDSSRYLMSKESYDALVKRGVCFTVQNKSNPVAVAVNPYSAYGVGYDPKTFIEKMKAAVPLPVINVKEL